jgi:hypothetical protein
MLTPPPPPSTPHRARAIQRSGKVKNDPKLVAAARELRDRYLEHVNADAGALLPRGKYDVSRALPGGPRSPSPAASDSALSLLASASVTPALPAPAAA